MSRLLVLPFVSLLATSVAAQYSTDFEAPTFTGSAAGTGVNGQDGFYIPAVTGSIDASIYTYAGNTVGVPANANGGAHGAQGVVLVRARQPEHRHNGVTDELVYYPALTSDRALAYFAIGLEKGYHI